MMRRDGDVGQRALEAVADLDAHLPVVLGDEEQRAVVLALAADLPLLGDADRIGLDRLRLRRRHDQHDELVAGARFPVGELRLERLLSPRRQRLREIGDVRASAAESAAGRRCPPPTAAPAAPSAASTSDRQRRHLRGEGDAPCTRVIVVRGCGSRVARRVAGLRRDHRGSLAPPRLLALRRFRRRFGSGRRRRRGRRSGAAAPAPC